MDTVLQMIAGADYGHCIAWARARARARMSSCRILKMSVQLVALDMSTWRTKEEVVRSGEERHEGCRDI